MAKTIPPVSVANYKIHPKGIHDCGNGFKGTIIEVKTKRVKFCQFCGKEFK